jgi:hypothetical protein
MLVDMTEGSGEPPADPPQPAKATTPAEFTAALRALRTWSGLTYRQLEGKAATYRDALPASTIATTLGRATLPRERFVDAFTRACGLGEDDVRVWLDTRKRIAMNETPEEEPAPEPVPEQSRRRQVAWVAIAAVVGLLIGATATIGSGGLSGSRTEASTLAPPPLADKPIAGLDITAVGRWVRIHPAGNATLCVSHGLDRTRRYEDPVAASMPCETVVLPHVYFEPVGENVVEIQWHNPEFGIGCLTLLTDGPARDMLEPWDDCDEENPAQRFRLERVGAFFRIRVDGTGQCLGQRSPHTEGAEIIQSQCSGKVDQNFTIELLSPPV